MLFGKKEHDMWLGPRMWWVHGCDGSKDVMGPWMWWVHGCDGSTDVSTTYFPQSSGMIHIRGWVSKILRILIHNTAIELTVSSGQCASKHVGTHPSINWKIYRSHSLLSEANSWKWFELELNERRENQVLPSLQCSIIFCPSGLTVQPNT